VKQVFELLHLRHRYLHGEGIAWGNPSCPVKFLFKLMKHRDTDTCPRVMRFGQLLKNAAASFPCPEPGGASSAIDAGHDTELRASNSIRAPNRDQRVHGRADYSTTRGPLDTAG
jgi:hypothetical protein